MSVIKRSANGEALAQFSPSLAGSPPLKMTLTATCTPRSTSTVVVVVAAAAVSVKTPVIGWDGGAGAPASGMDVPGNVSLGLSLKYPRNPITTKFESSTARH